jgi:hypothetical protein
MKPKEILVDLPAVHIFSTEDEISALAAAANTFVHGKVKIKCETIGILGGQFVGLFYIQRNEESQFLRDSFIQAINKEESLGDDDPYPEDDTDAV